MRWLKLCTIGAFPEVSFQIWNTLGIFLANKVMNNSWTIVWPNVLQFYLVSSRQPWQMSWDTYEIIFWKTLVAAFTKFWKWSETLAAMALRHIFFKVSLVLLVVFLKGLACLIDFWYAVYMQFICSFQNYM